MRHRQVILVPGGEACAGANSSEGRLSHLCGSDVRHVLYVAPKHYGAATRLADNVAVPILSLL